MDVRELTVSYGDIVGTVDGRCLTTPRAAADIINSTVGAATSECFVMLALDVRSRVTHSSIVSRGTLTASLVHPREVFRSAILANAASIIIGHNHPSGTVLPSREDGEVTERIEAAGELLGIRMLDHVIVAGSHDPVPFYSFMTHGVRGVAS